MCIAQLSAKQRNRTRIARKIRAKSVQTVPRTFRKNAARHLVGEQLFDSDPELAMLLDNVAEVLSERTVTLTDEIAELECEE
ncbi:hypothetical protein [Rhizobium leguminosarum]|uniref:hypothetical protein n=1 Tax=Rhizobium leguminosarum TaxID=384 RepID=UPI001C942BC9|nr:hypothetical protein [Rhizobium leguminosarum]MBY5404614.1 hypothetical protein [Rhizobium leguminosarum]